MALTSQIEAAARTQRAPVGGSNLSQESPLLSMPARERTAEQQRLREEKEKRDGRTAGRQTVRTLLSHPCDLDPDNGVTECGHPGHGRDAKAVREMLDALGLLEQLRRSASAKPATKRCTKCDEVKPLEDFPLRYTVGARRTSHCRVCRAEQNKASRARRKEEGR